MSADCVFCEMVRGTQPASIVWEDEATLAVVRVARAISVAFPNQGMSLWHSIGEAAFQEVPHLHIHVHPRMLGDDLLQVYPRAPALPDRAALDGYAAVLRAHLVS